MKVKRGVKKFFNPYMRSLNGVIDDMYGLNKKGEKITDEVD